MAIIKMTSATTGFSTLKFTSVLEFKLLMIGVGNCMINWVWHLGVFHSQLAEMTSFVGEPLPEVDTRSAH